MKLIVGLGNPGKEYENTRHNVGFMVVEAIGTSVVGGKWLVVGKNKTYTLGTGSICLTKPQTFMNNSGLAVKELVKNYQIPNTNLYIVHDDLDIRLGEYKIDFAKGPKLHNGIKSIEEHLKTDQFWRVRVGVDNRPQKTNAKDQMHNEGRMPGEKYVLEKFLNEELTVLKRVIDDIVLRL